MNDTDTDIATVTDSAMVPASPKPAPTLASQEKIILYAVGKAIYDVGSALHTIREHRLYRETKYTTFDAYCIQQWGFTRNRADQLIQAHRLIEQLKMLTNVSTLRGHTMPRTEAQIRPLLRLKTAEARFAAWRDVLDKVGERATMAEVAEAVDYQLAIEADPAARDLPREEAVRLYREQKAARSSRDAHARPTTITVLPVPDGDAPLPELRTVIAVIRDLNLSTRVWVEAMDALDRGMVSSLIGDLYRLADALTQEVDTLVREERSKSAMTDGDGHDEWRATAASGRGGLGSTAPPLPPPHGPRGFLERGGADAFGASGVLPQP